MNAATSTSVVNPPNIPTRIINGIATSHFARHSATKAFLASKGLRLTPDLNPCLTPQAATTATRSVPGKIPARKILFIATPAVTP